MIIEGIPYQKLLKASASLKTRSLSSFVDFFEKRLHAQVFFESKKARFSRPDLLKPLTIGEQLLAQKVITSYFPITTTLPDEPPLKVWSSICNEKNKTHAGGASVDSDENALYAALAEGLERYLWYTQSDYFRSPVRATEAEIAQKGSYLAPQDFAAFSDKQRAENPRLLLAPKATYLWIQGESLLTHQPVFVPAQVVSAAVYPFDAAAPEPLIREQTTIGLATWNTRPGAQLRGILEILEREAYTIMWLNQLTLPQVALSSLGGKNKDLDALVASCEKYRLRVHAIYMPTDAPTHAVGVVVEDASMVAPRFTIGLKAHQHLPEAVLGALLEALRARHAYRGFFARGGEWDPKTPVDKIGHRERLYYWAMPEHTAGLEFLIQGEEIAYTFDAMWEKDTSEEYSERLLAWCKDTNIECVSVSLGTSKKNPTPWHVEMIIMPELQPTYLVEWYRHLGGTRLTSVPKKLGLATRATPFVDAPHPYT